jgi:hypothetical protein
LGTGLVDKHGLGLVRQASALASSAGAAEIRPLGAAMVAVDLKTVADERSRVITAAD